MTEVKWSERMIARAISIQLLERRCIVLLENTTWAGAECDVLGVTMDMRLIDIEVKISRADLKRDYYKDKWWDRLWHSHEGPERLLGFPRKVWKHYYAMPAEIWKPELAEALPSPNSGILLLRKPTDPREPPVVVHCVRRATPNKDAYRLTAAETLDVARLANLRYHEVNKQLDSLLRQQNVGTLPACEKASTNTASPGTLAGATGTTPTTGRGSPTASK